MDIFCVHIAHLLWSGCLHSPKFTLKLSPQGDGVKKWGLEGGQVMNVNGHDWNLCPYEKGPRILPFPSAL